MASIIILKKIKASIAKSNDKSHSGDKTLVVDPAIRFYEIEDGDKNQ